MAASRSPSSATAFAIGRPMITTVRKASAAALVCLATAAQAAEGELWFRKPEKVALARGIQKDGFPCPEIKAVYFIGAKSDGNHMRAVCGDGRRGGPVVQLPPDRPRQRQLPRGAVGRRSVRGAHAVCIGLRAEGIARLRGAAGWAGRRADGSSRSEVTP